MNAVVDDVELRKGACLTKLGGVVIYSVWSVSMLHKNGSTPDLHHRRPFLRFFAPSRTAPA